MSSPSTTDGFALAEFTATEHTGHLRADIAALEAFDRTEQLQELKALAHARTGIGPGKAVLDVGCGFGLETLRIARLVQPGGTIAGIDLSRDFIEEARRRASDANATIDYRTGQADTLPFADESFDVVRAERLLIYVPDLRGAIAELRRTARPGGSIALIEPDLGTSTINLADRALVRRVMGHEADANVAHGWIPGPLADGLRAAGLTDIEISTRVVIFPRDLAKAYFIQCARSAMQAGVIGEPELAAWTEEVTFLAQANRLFCSISYFLFTARRSEVSAPTAPLR